MLRSPSKRRRQRALCLLRFARCDLNEAEDMSDTTKISSIAAWTAIVAAGVVIVALTSLRVLSPEFDPAWRVISEYALGRYGWVLSLLFISWAISTWSLAVAVRSQLPTRWGKIGWWLLVSSGFGAALASVFEINHPMHQVAGTIGLLGPVSAVIVSVNLSRTPAWSASRRPLLWTAHLTWIGVVLFFLTLVLLNLTESAAAGGSLTTQSRELPPGAIALVGYANRLGVVVSCLWHATVAWHALRFRDAALPGPVPVA